jgi:polysaccharide biosynthesis/export protein
MRSKLIFCLLSVILVFNSCISHKQLTYLQYIGKTDNTIIETSDLRATITPSAYKLMPYDILFISVTTPDPSWSALFNIGSGGSSMTLESASLLGYSVDEAGNIELPFIGSLGVAGKTLSELKIDLDSTLKNYVTDASISVKLVNNFISIIGEVNAPGRYPLTKYQVNILEALSMAGDLSYFSNRQKVQLIRQSLNGPIIKEFSLKDRSILTSAYYYLMPNDIIYVQPLKTRTFQINSSTYSLILGSISTILASITTLFVLFNYRP